MPEPEPNKKWDALLQAYAKKHRRDIELRPVSRRALQDEVKKTFGQSDRSARRSLFSNWWLRIPLATIFAAFAVLLIIQNRRFEESKATSNSLPLLELAKKAPMGQATTDGVREKSTVASGAVNGFGGENFAARKLAAPMSAPPAAPAGVADNLRSAASVMAQARSQFQNNISQNNIPRFSVLNSFSVNRRGDNVLVTDSDGSVYSGGVEDKKDQSQASYTFAVHGRNQSIQQTVDFTGRVEPLPVQALSSAASSQVNGVVTNGLSQNQLGQAQSAQAQQFRVVGAAVVGGASQIKVDATLSP